MDSIKRLRISASRTLCTCCAVLLFGALAPRQLAGQAVGSIHGVITDPGGAVVPNATVTATQTSTGFARKATSSASGNYTLPLLPVGTYQVQAESSGFQVSSIQVSLDVNEQREVDFTLAVSGVATQIEVQAVAPTIDTSTGTLGGVVEGRQVANLPLNGRDIQNLVLMLPGQVPEPDSSFPFTTDTAGNGNRGTTGASYLDGVDSSDNELGGGQFGNFNLDAIAEFRVLQNNYSAEYGRGGGTIVNIVTKSGANDPHGSLFEFVRNDKFNGRNFFAPSVAPFRRNEFGGTFGGPVWIPKVYNGKNRTFFFVEAAEFTQRLAVPVVISVPTSAERTGVVAVTPASGPNYNLQVPITSAASAILNKYPLPNEPNGTYGANTFASAFSQPLTRKQFSVRLDQKISEKDSLFFRYSLDNNTAPDQDTNEAAINPSFTQYVANNWVNFGLSETHLFSNKVINEIRISGMRSLEQEVSQVFNQTQATFADGAFNSYGPDDGGGGFSLAPFTMSFWDALTWVSGRHTLNFGGEFRKVNSSYFGTSSGGPNGFYQFAAGSILPVAVPASDGTDSLSAGAPSPSSVVSFMTGISQFYSRSVAYPGFGPSGGGFEPFSMRRKHWSGWVQDDIKLTKSLTINLGLRYEFNSVPHEPGDRLSGFVDNPTMYGSSSLLGDLLLNPQPPYRSDYRGLAPRFGWAWKVVPKTVVRGGFGIFTNLPMSQLADQQGFNFPFAGNSSVPNLTFTNSPRPLSLAPLTDLKGNVLPPQSGNTKSVPPNTPINLAPYPGLLGNWNSDNLHNGYTMSGNFTIERELPFGMVLQAGYVFNNAVGLYGQEFPYAYTGANPSTYQIPKTQSSIAEILLADNHAHSTYNSLQVMLRKPEPVHGFSYELSYTYSKSLDNASTEENGDAMNAASFQNEPNCWRCEKGPSAFDVPQRVVANFSYQIPFDHFSSLPKRLTQGWMLWGIASASAGSPFTVAVPFGSALYGIDGFGNLTTRPFLTRTPTYRPAGQGPEEQLFSNAVLQDSNNLIQAVNTVTSFSGQFFSVPLTTLNGSTVMTAPGNLGRNTFRTDGWSDGDLSIVKNTKLNERVMLQFRAEFFNVLNQHVFSAPNRVLGSPGFGIATSTMFDPREIQFGLRLTF